MSSLESHPVMDLLPFNQDILHHVFEHSGPLDRTLCKAAIVCRAWTVPAQAALYRELFYFPLDNRPRDMLLARTMRCCPHLRRYVRRLSLMTLWTHSPTEFLCDWIQLLPAHCLREFQWTWIRGHILPPLINSPAVQTISQIQLRGRFYNTEKLQSILQLPLLKSLSLELTGHEEGDIYPLESTRLKHLSIYLSVEHGPIFDKLLAVVGAQLESLRVSRKFCFASTEDKHLVDAIEAHCPILKRLSMFAPFVSSEPVTVVDRLVGRYRLLQHLCCSEGTYTANMYKVLPTTLRTLELFFDGASLPHETALLDFLTSVRSSAFKKLIITVKEDDLARYKSLAEICERSGIAFSRGQAPYVAG